MQIVPRGYTYALIIMPLLILTACAAPPAAEQPPPLAAPQLSPDPFPRPEGLQPQIDFWRNVYAVWGLGQVVLHDDEYLDLVYEVIDLPGRVSEGYTREQKDFIRYRREALKARLQELERKVTAQQALDPAERALAARIAAVAGSIEGAHERLRGQRGQRERFRRGLEISGRYDGMFREIFRQAGLPEDLAFLPHVESSFQAHARSSAGAVGMWQFTLPAARTYMNMHPALDERLDPVASARGAARYLRDAYDKLDHWALAVTSYNHGIGGMKRARHHLGTDFVRIVREYEHPYFGFASRNFYAEFLAAREVAGDPERYFPEGIRYQPPLNWEQIALEQTMPASEIARQYGVKIQELVALNTAWTQAAAHDRVAVPAGTQVWLPTGTLLGHASGPALALANPPAATQDPSSAVK